MSAPPKLRSDDVVRCGVFSNAITLPQRQLMHGVNVRCVWIPHVKKYEPQWISPAAVVPHHFHVRRHCPRIGIFIHQARTCAFFERPTLRPQ